VKRQLDLVDMLFADLDDLPYASTIKLLRHMGSLHTLNAKLQCLSAAANSILTAVDKYYPDKTQNLVMGAEDKFPVLIYAVILSNEKQLFSQMMFLLDFTTDMVGDDDSKYRTSEFNDAIKYVLSLEWQIRDESDTLVPLQSLLTIVADEVSTIHRVPLDPTVSPQLEERRILHCASYLFRNLADRREDPYSPFLIKKPSAQIIKKYFTFFNNLINAGTGLILVEEPDTQNDEHNNNNNNKNNKNNNNTTIDDNNNPNEPAELNIWVHFKVKLPLYVYEKIAEVMITREFVPEIPDDQW